MIQRIKDIYWALCFSFALRRFQRNCDRMAKRSDAEVREWIAGNRWAIKDMTEGLDGDLADIIETELKLLEWSIEK